MKSAAAILLEMYGVNTKSVNTTAQSIVTSLLYTLQRTLNLNEAFDDIDKTLSLDKKEDLKSKITSLVQIPEMVALHNDEKTLRLVIELYPYIRNTINYEEVCLPQVTLNKIFNATHKNHNYVNIKKSLVRINKLDLGYKILQKARAQSANIFHIVKYNDRDELISILKEHNLMTPTVLDKIL